MLAWETMRTSCGCLLGLALSACQFDSSGHGDGGVGGSSSATTLAGTGDGGSTAASTGDGGHSASGASGTSTGSSDPTETPTSTAAASDSSGAVGSDSGGEGSSSSGAQPTCSGLLWVSNVDGPAGTTDQSLYDALSAAGHEITYALDDQVIADDATGYCAVLLSAVSDSSDILDEFELVDVPVVVWEYGLFDDMGFGSSGLDESAVDIEIIAPEHELAAGLDGTVVLYGGVGRINWAQTTTATVIAQRPGNPAKATLLAYEVGDVLEDGSLAPARRVGLPMCNAGSGTLQPDAITLLLAAVTWATG